MINGIIDGMRQTQFQQQNRSRYAEQISKMQAVNVLDKDQFLLILVINLILATMSLSIFKVALGFVFITSLIKFYKTYLMEKHVDHIQITSISTQPKTSICIHYASRLIHGILTQKALFKNLFYIALLFVFYFVFKMVPFYMILLGIVNIEYMHTLKKRFDLRRCNKKARQQFVYGPKRRLLNIKRTQSIIQEVDQQHMSMKQSLAPPADSLTPQGDPPLQQNTNNLNNESTEAQIHISQIETELGKMILVQEAEQFIETIQLLEHLPIDQIPDHKLFQRKREKSRKYK